MIECVARGIPPGLGEPVFDKLEADLAKAILSIPAAKAFEIGSGFGATRMRGSQHNDAFETRAGKIRTTTNDSGGVQGGISNGEEIYFRVAFKPPATIALEQKTVTNSKDKTELAARGRHDPCVLPRAVPIVEAMAAIVLCDHALRQNAVNCGFPNRLTRSPQGTQRDDGERNCEAVVGCSVRCSHQARSRVTGICLRGRNSLRTQKERFDCRASKTDADFGTITFDLMKHSDPTLS